MQLTANETIFLLWAVGAFIAVFAFIGRDNVGQDADINTRGFAVNALLNSDNSFCDGWVDVGANAAFSSQAAASDTTYYTTDKIHLTNVGYDLVATLSEPTVRGLI